MENLIDYEKRPLEVQETKMLIVLLSGIDDKQWDEIKDHVPIAVAIKRFEATEQPYDRGLLIFVISLCANLAQVIIWCYTIHCIQKDLGKVATLDDLCSIYFAEGVPIDEAYKVIWEAQKDEKAPLGNALDRMGDWPRI